MSQILVPTTGLESWKARLADPVKQWQRGFSAFETAVSWELASRTKRGLPITVAEVLDKEEELRGSEVLFALPEHKVPLRGRGKSSQNDVWVLLRASDGQLISMAVEAKVDEEFGDTLESWDTDSPNKQERLRYLHELLKCETSLPPVVRYQLVHRTASALIEAGRIGATYAVMMVQSFRENSPSKADYAAFANCFNVIGSVSAITQLTQHTNPKLYLGWATSPICTDGDIARVCD